MNQQKTLHMRFDTQNKDHGTGSTMGLDATVLPKRTHAQVMSKLITPLTINPRPNCGQRPENSGRSFPQGLGNGRYQSIIT
ncbi:hypothetical protein [Azospirillum sp. B510]|uniref:hypothetical protein n=1 Tax=Azospirillum sp. (strain B510) TaxID=137722 RepID=UPI0011D095DE|nr:hypothetical protein [Azospirillum sp. B510]